MGAALALGFGSCATFATYQPEIPRTWTAEALEPYDGPFFDADDIRDPDWHEHLDIELTFEGVFPYARWVVRERGGWRRATRPAPCATSTAHLPLRLEEGPLEPLRRVATVLVAAPWTDAPDDPSTMTREELAAAYQAIPR